MEQKDADILNELKELYFEEGIEALKDEDLIAMIIRKGDPLKNVLELSEGILRRCENGSQSLKELSLSELISQNKGLSEIKALQLLCGIELGKRAYLTKEIKYIITCPEDIFELLGAEMGLLKKEYFKAAYLNTKGMLLGIEDISVGTINTSLVHPREIFSCAIKKNANSVILIHNHPSGDPLPSKEDKEVTDNIVKAGEILGIKVFDHIIIAKDQYYSFREEILI